MYDTIYNLILSMRYASIFVLMFVFPTETIMPVVGYIAALGYVSLPLAIAVGVAGTTLWSLVVYTVARWVGPQGLDALIAKYGRFLGLRKVDVRRAGKWFDRHAGVAVLVGRFVPGLRTAVCIPAGLRHMPRRQFLAYALLGSTVDAALLAYLGYTAQGYYDELQVLLDSAASVVVLGLVLIVVSWWVWRRYR